MQRKDLEFRVLDEGRITSAGLVGSNRGRHVTGCYTNSYGKEFYGRPWVVGGLVSVNTAS